MHPLGNDEVTTPVPASPIHHQKQVFVWPYLLFLGEGGEGQRKGLSIDGRHEQPTGLSTLRLDKAIEVHPLIARPDHCPNAAAFPCPDPAQDGFEADAMLILAPQFNLSLWICLLQLVDLLGQFF